MLLYCVHHLHITANGYYHEFIRNDLVDLLPSLQTERFEFILETGASSRAHTYFINLLNNAKYSIEF